MSREDRAVSTSVNYILGLTIMFLLATGLLIAAGDFVDTQRDQAIRSELQVVGQQIANDVARIDRVVEGSDSPGTNISTNQTVPAKVAGETYTIQVRNTSTSTTPHLLLSTNNPDIAVRVNLTARTPLRETALDGGRLTVRLNRTAGSSGQLEVING